MSPANGLEEALRRKPLELELRARYCAEMTAFKNNLSVDLSDAGVATEIRNRFARTSTPTLSTEKRYIFST